MTFDFPRLIEHVTRTRRLGAGAVVGSGTVSKTMIAPAAPRASPNAACWSRSSTSWATTSFLRFGDRVRIEMFDREGRSIFGAIDQGRVVPAR